MLFEVAKFVVICYLETEDKYINNILSTINGKVVSSFLFLTHFIFTSGLLVLAKTLSEI